MQKKKKSPALTSLYFFGGICLCLISVSLIMNVWWIARVVTFIPMFTLGAGSYLIYLFIYVLGMSLLFREKGLKPKRILRFLGIILLSLSIIVGFSLATTAKLAQDNPTLLNDWINKFGNIKNYTSLTINGPINLLTTPKEYGLGILEDGSKGLIANDLPFGGGLLGTAIVCGFMKIGDISGLVVGWISVVLVGLISIFMIFSKEIIGLIRNGGKKIAKEQDEANDIFVSSQPANQIPNSPIPTQPMFNTPVQPQIAPVNKPVEQELPQVEKRVPISSQPASVPMGVGYGNIGVFTQARYIRPGVQQPSSQQTNAPASNEIREESREERIEQTFFDFDAKPEINEELVQAKPTFEEPVYERPSMPAPAVQQPVAESISASSVMESQPIQETPVVKKPIKWVPPSSDMLLDVEVSEALERNNKVAQERVTAIDEAFQDYGIGAHVESFTVGPSVTRFNIKYDSNTSSKTIERYVSDLSRRLGGVNTRFEAVVEGQYTSGLEVPNATITTVTFKEVYEKLPDVKKHPLAVAFGKNIQGDVIWADFNEFPHALVAGTTGSGKSVFVNSVITSLIMRNSPDNLKIILIDPKKVEMTKYRDIPHLLCPVVNDANQAKLVMQKLVEEMESRYSQFDAAEGCTSLKEYNEYCEMKGMPKMPYIIVFIDEYADLVDSCKEISLPVVSIGQKARACGIHMLISTQRPSTNIITGVIKGNLPTHVALMTANTTDSITIVGEGGAETLLGKGDMLVQSPLVSRVGMVRLQSCFIQRQEMVYVVGYLKQHYPTDYDPKFLNLEEPTAAAGAAAVACGEVAASYDGAEEARYQDIKDWVMAQEYMSMSRIQRECAVGFNRAGRFFNRLQQEGIVSKEAEANRGCKVLAYKDNVERLPSSDELSHIG